jgi:hypothetical protein
MEKYKHIGYGIEAEMGTFANIRYLFAWQDTEKRDTLFLTIEGQALDPRPAAASIRKTVDDRVERIALQNRREASEGRPHSPLRGRVRRD